MPIVRLRDYAELALDESTIPERVALLEEHEAAVQASIDELRGQQARLQEKLDWYRGELATRTAAMSTIERSPRRGR